MSFVSAVRFAFRSARSSGLLALATICAITLTATGCGYGFSGSKNPWAAKGVRKIYIRMMTNNTLKAGVEIPFTSALVKEFARGGRIELVGDERDADAVIVSTIDSFTSTIGPMSSVAQLSREPEAQALGDMVVASEYIANANITVGLMKKDGPVLWTQTFNRPKVYPAGNRFGLQGTTSSLINASQEQLALGEIAQFIASDVYDTMLEAF